MIQKIRSFFSRSNNLTPKETTNSHWYNSDFLSNGISKSGIAIDEKVALQNSANYACQKGISESLAMLPRKIYEENDGVRLAVKDHPSAKCLIKEANPLMTSFVFFRTVEQHALAHGNGYAELEFQRGTGNVISMYPIPSDRVTPKVVLNDEDKLELLYEVKVPSGETVYLPKEKILHVSGLGYDGIKGYPALELMLHTLGLSEALEDFSSLFFKQGAQQSGYVSIPDDMDDEQIKNLRKHYQIINEGLSNAHRFKFLYDSAKFVPASNKPSDSQMLESRIFQIQEIARFYRYPLHKLQELSNRPSYSSLEQFNLEFVNDTLMPRICMWEQEINRKFFTDPKDENKYIKFNVNALLRGDINARSNYYRTMVMTGIFTVNEARALEDLPPVDGGDERMMPLNMEPVSEKSLKAQQRVQD